MGVPTEGEHSYFWESASAQIFQISLWNENHKIMNNNNTHKANKWFATQQTNNKNNAQQIEPLNTKWGLLLLFVGFKPLRASRHSIGRDTLAGSTKHFALLLNNFANVQL